MVILVQINCIEDRSEAILPLGILSVGSALKKRGIDVELVNINDGQIDRAVKYIIKCNPLYVGFSVMTGIQTQHSAEMSRKIKAQKKNIPIVWGGIHPSLLPDQCLASKYIDFVVVGEGEETALEFTDQLRRNKDFVGILGLGYKKHGERIVNPKRPFITNLDQYRLDFNLLDLNKYIFKLDKYDRVITYKTSRGCPFNCFFCYNQEFNLNTWRAWSKKTVLEDIEFLKKKYNIQAVKFYDDNFFVDKKRALDILNSINLPTHTEIRIDAIDEHIAKELKRLQSFDLLIGMESGSNRILKLMNKQISVDRIIEAVRILDKYDLRGSYSTMIGLPTETREEFNATIDLMYKVYTLHRKARFTLGVFLPYPGSRLYKFSVEHGFKSPQKTEDWGKIDRFRNKFTSPWIDAGVVWRIREYFKFLSMDLGPFNKWLEWRIKNRFFAIPLDIYLLEYLSHIAIRERGVIGKALRGAHNLFKKC